MSNSAEHPAAAASIQNTAPGKTLGKLVVISGPSGTGKTSICQELLRRLPRASWSVSATTRPIRAGEVNGQSYEFIAHDEFIRRREQGDFLEWAEYLGQLYGTPRRPVEEALRAGRHILLEIEVQGGMQVAKQMPASIRVFVMPPDMESLKARLEGRKTEHEEQLRRRLAKADGEIALARDSGCYDYFVVNDDLMNTVDEMIGIIERE